jgi:hypothetical protein
MRRGVSLAEICKSTLPLSFPFDTLDTYSRRRSSSGVLVGRSAEQCSRLCESEDHGSQRHEQYVPSVLVIADNRCHACGPICSSRGLHLPLYWRNTGDTE